MVVFRWKDVLGREESLTTSKNYFKLYATSLMQDYVLDEISNVTYAIDDDEPKKLTFKTLEQ